MNDLECAIRVESTTVYSVVDNRDYYVDQTIGYRFELSNAEALRHFCVENDFFRYSDVWDNYLEGYEIMEIEII